MNNLSSIHGFPVSTRLVVTPSPLGQAIDDVPALARLSLQFKLVPQEPLAEDVAADVKQMCDIFLSAVSRNLFGPTDTLGAESNQGQADNVTLRHANGLCVEVNGEIKGLPASAYRALLCLLAQTHYAIAPFSQLDLVISESAISPKLLAEPLSIPFPEANLAGPSRFDLDLLSEPDEEDEITVRIILANEESARIFDLVENIVADWDSIVMTGGYRDSFSPLPDIIHYPWETSIVDQSTIEHQVSIFTGGKDEIDGLLLMMRYVDSFVAPIAKIELE